MKISNLFATTLSIAAVTACSAAAPTSAKLTAVGPLSATFAAKCASCHGDQGEGDIGPKLTGLSLDAYSAAVREGRAGMPSFTEAVYSEADLKKDHASLN